MSAGLRRAVAHRLCGVLRVVLPKRLEPWSDALRSEIADITHDGEALRFVFAGFCGLMPRALLAHIDTAAAAIARRGQPPGDQKAMRYVLDHLRQPRLVGTFCAIGAVLLGLVYMAAAGAPTVYLGVNLAALATGAALSALTVRMMSSPGRRSDIGIVTMAALLLATSLFGNAIDGAARWVMVGPLFVQTSLILLPMMIVAFARNRSMIGAGGVVLAALALALQPDRAMAGVMLAGLAALALYRLDRCVGIGLVAAALAFLATLARPDMLPAVPYVDRILYSAFDVHPLAGLAVLAGSALLIVPAIAGWQARDAEGRSAVVFGSVWLAVILAAALGNYPTPVVGYGGSAVIGYLLSLAALPKRIAPSSQIPGDAAHPPRSTTPRELMRTRLALQL